MDKEGLSIDCFTPGTTLMVKTSHSEYTIKIVNTQREILINGGSGSVQYHSPAHAFFLGSPEHDGWIYKNSPIKFIEENRIIYTSAVKEVEVISPDGSWKYFMHWSDNE